MFVKAVASNLKDATFFSVSSSDVVSKYMGESEKLVRELFEQAKNSQPSVIFIDEIDAIGSSREMTTGSNSESINRLKTELLIRMQDVLDMDKKKNGISDVIVIGATNRPFDLDPALRRRFQKRIFIPLPDLQARKRLFQINMQDVDTNIRHEDFDEFAKGTEGYSGSDISVVCRDALMKPIRKAMKAQYFRKVCTFSFCH